MIELVRDEVNLAVSDVIKAPTLGDKLVHQSVCVFIQAYLAII